MNLTYYLFKNSGKAGDAPSRLVFELFSTVPRNFADSDLYISTASLKTILSQPLCTSLYNHTET